MGRFCVRDLKPLARLLPWVVCGLLACGGDRKDPGPTEPGGDGNDPGTIGPNEGALEIITSTTGLPLTPDPWFVTVDDGAPLLVAPNAADTVAPLGPGPHTVRLDVGAPHCVPQTENPQTVEVTAGETMSARFEVICHPALRLSVSTTGSEPDPDGYDVSIDGDLYAPLPPDDFFIILFHPILTPGPHTIALSGLEPNCAVSGEHPRTVHIVETESAIVQLDVVCNPAGTLEVGVATNGGDPDPDGYVVTLNGGPRRWISAEGGRFEFLAPGAYTVALFDVAPHCTLSGPNTATATLVSGGTAAVDFTVTCGPLETVPPGRDLLVVANTEIYLLSADGSRFVNLTDDTDHKSDPRWSPDGRKIAFTSGHDEIVHDPYQRRFVSHVFVMNADGSGRTQLTHGESEGRAAWSPDGNRIAYIETSADSSYLSIINADGSGQTRLINVGSGIVGAPAWSPDGTKIAYGSLSSDHGGIVVVNVDGSGAVRLTHERDAGVAWSPDGTRIAFVRFVGQGDQMYVINADGSGLTQLTSDPGDSQHSLSWSPDGTKIAFGLGGNIYLVNGNGTGLTQLTLGPSAALPGWSPDGSKIAYYLIELTQNRLFLMNLDGSGEVPLTPPWSLGRPGSPAAWRP
jgi:Tol biopolymer transport system component